jgi:hypothetical protein
MDGEASQPRELGLETRGSVEDDDLLLVFEIKFFENGGHGFL